MSKFMEDVTAKAIANFNKQANTKVVHLTKSEIFVITDILETHSADLYFKAKSLTDQAHIARIADNRAIIKEIIAVLNKEGK